MLSIESFDFPEDMGKIKRFLWEWRAVGITTPSMAGLVILLRFLGLLQSWDWAAFDQYMRWRPPPPQDDRIVIVGIEEADMQYLHQGYIADGVYAKLLKKLKARKPRAIGLDIYRDLPFEPGHQDLVKVFESTDYVIGIQKVVGDRNSQPVPPPPVLKAKDQVGANDVIADADNKIRRGFIYLADANNKPVYSFSFYLALLYLQKEGITVQGNKDWQLGKTVFSRFQSHDGGYIRADDNGYQMLLNYQGSTGSFNTVSLRDILEDRVPKDWGRDRIILIGMVGESFNDLFYTPYSGDLLSIPEPMSGVEVQAHLTSQILNAALKGNALIKSWSEPQEWLWIAFWSGVGAILTWRWRYVGKSLKSSFWWWGTTLILAHGVLLGSTYIAFVWGWWLPVVAPFLALTGAAIAITTYIANTADSIRKTFGRYLTDEVVATLLESPEGLKIGGKRAKITIVTSDLRGFTALSERLSPEAVVQVLNIYLEFMLDAIAQHQGTIDKFMGDGIVILFGAPTRRADDAQRGVACAVAMQLAMTAVNEKLAQLDLPTLAMGIGINTGEVVVGNIGSEKHTEYTVIGKEMNLAFRIETYTTAKQILISEATLKAIGSATLRIDGELQIKPKGVKELITVYDIGGIGEPYNLFLTKDTNIFIDLIAPIPIIYQIVDGKQVSANIFKGHLIKLSDQGALVQIENTDLDTALPNFINIKLNLLIDGNQEKLSEDIYAKISDKPATPGNFYLQFTFKPPAEAGILFKALSQSIKDNK